MRILSLILAAATRAASPCTPTTGDADAVLRRAADVMGMTRIGQRVLRTDATDVVALNYESDRWYPPYIVQTTALTQWFDPSTGVQRDVGGASVAGGSQYGGGTTLSSRLASYVVTDTAAIPSAALHGQLMATRPLDAWSVVADWIASRDSRVTEKTCVLREFPRLVLTRSTSGPHGGERLYIDPKSGYPVALERREGDYLWGQTSVQYVYATWQRVGEAHLPGTATRMVDGAPEITRSFGTSRLVPRDSAPSFALPSNKPMAAAIPPFLVPTNPDTIRVSPTTVLLRNRGYAEAVTLVHDTIFVLDATQGEQRAHQDSVWIGKLFPGVHPIVVVVTDLAFPHVAGVRYWVATGATIVSHRASREFLERIVARKWTDSLDLLERRRARGPAPRMKFRAVDNSLPLAGGAITLFAFDGPSSEGALGAFVRDDGFLWASDFVQTVSQPSQYLDEVYAAVVRVGITPAKLAAEHLPLIDWARVAPLAVRKPE